MTGSVQQTSAQQAMWNAFCRFEGPNVKDIDRKSIHYGGFSSKDIHTMSKNMLKTSIQNGKEGKEIYANFSEMINKLQDKESTGGAEITEEEQTELYEFMLNATGHRYEYSTPIQTQNTSQQTTQPKESSTWECLAASGDVFIKGLGFVARGIRDDITGKDDNQSWKDEQQNFKEYFAAKDKANKLWANW